MPFYKIFILLITFSSFIINANEENSIIDEYRVEIVIFKFKEVSTSENFVEELTIPSKSVITLVEPKLYLNETALNSFPKNDSFFQNLLKNLKPINNNSSENLSDKNKNVVNPKNWFRKNNKVIYLDDYQKKIIKSNDVQLLGAFSWVQGIDELDSSKFVFLENIDQEYGYFLKLYKKRFMHIDLKAYLGIVNDLQLESTKKYRNEYDPLIKKNIVDSNDIDLQIYLPNKSDKIEIKNNQTSSNVKKRPSRLDKFIDIEQRVFNEEIYLFDHPYFGVLVSIIKV